MARSVAKIPHPPTGKIVRGEELEAWLASTLHADPRVRSRAVQHLCPCHTRSNERRVWLRVIEMVDDVDPRVRGAVGDGSPREFAPAIVEALEGRYHDPDKRLRRRVRKLLAHHRRTGEINIL